MVAVGLVRVGRRAAVREEEAPRFLVAAETGAVSVVARAAHGNGRRFRCAWGAGS
jgi:hypothetical protein